MSSGIRHFEDLGVNEIVSTLQNLHEYVISEKVDGTQLLIGVDQDGAFYTSRETKGGHRCYHYTEYIGTGAPPMFAEAHAVLERQESVLKSYGLLPGTQVEVEVLFGALPNAVEYSPTTNFIVLLRSTCGNVDLHALAQPFAGVTIDILGEDWRFVTVPVINTPAVCHAVNLAARNASVDLNKFLNTVDPELNITYLQVLTTPRNKKPVWLLGPWSDTKKRLVITSANLLPQYRAHLIVLKEALLELIVRPLSSRFGPPIKDGGWIEGVVFCHPVTSQTFKLVDKSTFLAVKDFYWKVRNEITQSRFGASSIMGNLRSELALVIDCNSTRDDVMLVLKNYRKILLDKLDCYNTERSTLSLTIPRFSKPFVYCDEVDSRTRQVFLKCLIQIDSCTDAIRYARGAEILASVALMMK